MIAEEYLRIYIEAQDKASSQIKKVQDALNKAKGVSLAIGAAAAAAGGAIIKFGSDFEKAMTQSTAIMVGLTDEMREKMEETALAVSKELAVSAKDLADAYYYLASAGLDAKQSIAALPLVAKFATAGQFDLKNATDLLTDAQTALGLSSRDAAENLENMQRVADVLVRANTLANASVEQFSRALTNKAAAAAKVVGKDIEEVVAVLAAFADRGVKAEEAGEKVNQLFRDLPRAVARNRDMFEKFGIEIVDAQGNLKHTADIIEELGKKFDGLSDAETAALLDALGLNRGVADAVKILYGAEDAIRAYEAELRKASGFTDKVAKEQLKNFSDQMRLLVNQAIAEAIELYKKLQPMLMALVPVLKSVMDGFFNFMQYAVEHKEVMAALAGVLTGLLIPAFYAVATAVASTLAAMAPFAVIGAVIGGAAYLIVKNWDKVKAVFNAVREVVVNLLTESGYLDSFKNAWSETASSLSGIWQSIKDFAESVFEGLRAFWERWGDNIISAFIDVGQVIMSTFELVFNTLSNVFGLIDALLRGDWADVWDHAKNIVLGFKDYIVWVFEFIKRFIFDIGPVIVSALVEALRVLDTKIKGIFSGVVNAIVNYLSSLPAKSAYWAGRLIGAYVNILITMPDRLRRILASAVSAIVGQLQGAPGKMRRGLNSIKNAVINMASSAVNSAVNWFRGLPSKILRYLSNLPSALYRKARSIASSFWRGFKKGLGISSPSLPERALMAIAEKAEIAAKVVKKSSREFKRISIPAPVKEVGIKGVAGVVQASRSDGSVEKQESGGRVEIVLRVEPREFERLFKGQIKALGFKGV